MKLRAIRESLLRALDIFCVIPIRFLKDPGLSRHAMVLKSVPVISPGGRLPPRQRR